MGIRTTLAVIAPIVAIPVYAADPIELPAFIALPRPQPTLQLNYGSAPSQAIDVFLPAESGPHPVAILIHGGCWSNRTAGREQLRHLGAELARQGVAVWSIGYRRADEPGGGYPGTYQDVGDAIDRLRSEASQYNRDVARTVLVGHSADGHLALWAAARDYLPAGSQLHRAAPLIPAAVVSLAGIGDLKAYAPLVPLFCGPGILEHLTGEPSSGPRDAYADISPARLPAPQGHIVMISGILDKLVPPYAREMRDKRKAPVELVDIPKAGHFDLVTPGTPAQAEVNRTIAAELGLGP